VTRDEAMLKLLALEPASRDALVRETGWGIEETQRVLDELERVGRVAQYLDGYQVKTFCLPEALPARIRAPRRASAASSARLYQLPWKRA
jgi:DNA-binding IclR family transcriptional regulator